MFDIVQNTPFERVLSIESTTRYELLLRIPKANVFWKEIQRLSCFIFFLSCMFPVKQKQRLLWQRHKTRLFPAVEVMKFIMFFKQSYCIQLRIVFF